MTAGDAVKQDVLLELILVIFMIIKINDNKTTS